MTILEEVFKEQKEKIRVITAKESVADKYTQEVNRVQFPPVPIDAVVTDYTPTQMMYKTSGVIESAGKQIIVRKKYRSLVELSYLFEIRGETFSGWRQNGKMIIRTVGDFLRCYVYLQLKRD